MLKKTLARRVQYDNIAEDITDVAVDIVHLLSEQCHSGSEKATKEMPDMMKLQDQQQNKTKEQMGNELKENQDYVENSGEDKNSLLESFEILESRILRIENRQALEDTRKPADDARMDTYTDPTASTITAKDEVVTDVSSVDKYDKEKDSEQKEGEGEDSTEADSEDDTVVVSVPAEAATTNGLNASNGAEPLDVRVDDVAEKEKDEGCEKMTALQAAKPPPEQQKLKDIPMRDYQMELAIPALEGRNTIICAPNGSGKTRVAIKITRDHLDDATGIEGACVGARRRVVFLVNKVPLVEQQHNAFREYLSPKYDILPLSGETNAVLPVGETLPDYDVIILTAQVLENALRDELITLDTFSMLIFDECHHCQKNDPYNAIMTRYIKQKVEKSGTRLPQIIGLTASLGVGKAKSQKDAVEHILKACANLDAEWISQVMEHKYELQIYNEKPVEEVKAVSGRIKDPFADMINMIMEDIEKTLAMEASKHLTPEELKPPRQREKQAYEQWVVALARKSATLPDNVISRTIHAATTHLRKYTDALAINAHARTKDALQYLDKFVTGLQNEGFDDTDEDLVKHFIEARGKLQEYAADPKYSNPKLDQLKYLILKAYAEKPDSRCLLFCKTRALTIALLTWMQEDPALCKLNPGRLVGAGASGGMTKNQQVELLDLFTTGGRKIVISTSVAEEGIDIAKCNIVIRYDYVGNEIGHVQTRGRGRAEGSKSVLIAGREGGNVLKEKLNTIRERLMETAMLHVWNMQRDKHDDFKKEVQRLQDESKKERDLAKALKTLERKTKKICGKGMKLLCVKCKEFACNVSDFRKIKENHQVVVDKSFSQRIIIKPHPPKRIDDWEMDGKVYCKNCRQDWGIQMVYRKASFHTLKIESFVLEKPDGTRLTCRKWKKAPFDVKDITPDDISGMLETPEEDSEEEEMLYY
ncbi:DDX58 [Branchiostoma lanceolatum]|uniref:RNA helicase n=1 Tax=Branchiostoma lanceolatum TaxID=7740 RepID=A0A8K0ELP1_BRALA|nr:DDX58 [Branchiostoma lanceolatum]